MTDETSRSTAVHSPSPLRPAKWLVLPMLGLAVLTTVVVAARKRRTRRLGIANVSESWLRDFEYTSGRHVDV
jgi:hypothetical protein